MSVTVALRYDDYGADSDTSVERTVISVLRRHGLSAVFGVVPFKCDPASSRRGAGLSEHHDKTRLLRDAMDEGLVEAALHGCCHAFLPLSGGGFTEFAGRTSTDQSVLLRDGILELERCTGVRPTCFIPPFNSYDLETIEALAGTGITCLSASMFGPEGKPGVAMLPHTCSLTQTRQAVEGARRSGETAPLVVPLFHQFDFKENDAMRGRIDMAEFDELLSWLAAQPDVSVLTFSGVMARGHDLGPDRLIAQKRFLDASLHPWAAPHRVSSLARLRLPDTRQACRLRRGVLLRSVAVYACAALAGSLLGKWGLPAFMSVQAARAGAAASVAVWLSAVAARKERAYFRAIALTVFLAGMAVGTMVAG